VEKICFQHGYHHSYFLLKLSVLNCALLCDSSLLILSAHLRICVITNVCVFERAHESRLCVLCSLHGWRNLFQSGGHIANFVVWIGLCDVTSIEIWRHHICTIWRSNYTILNETTPSWKRIGEPPEIQIAVTGATQVNSVTRANHTIYSDWLNKTVRRLCRWNFHLLSFWLALSLACDVMLCNNKREILMITSHRAMITPQWRFEGRPGWAMALPRFLAGPLLGRSSFLRNFKFVWLTYRADNFQPAKF